MFVGTALGKPLLKIGTVLDIKKAPWQKKCPVFQLFLAVVYRAAFAV
jgi:hypothetical protein